MGQYLFLPHCLKNSTECRARMTEDGLQCLKCGKCDIATIVEYAKNNYFKVFIVPGGSMVKRIIEKYSIDLSKDIIVGVACENEISVFHKDLFKRKPDKKRHKAIGLIKTGCVDTKADLNEIFSVIDSFSN
jgi:hypothetical protein